MSKQMISTRLRLPIDLYTWLKALAEREGRSLHGQILYILRQKMAAETPDPPF